ncbi:CubicO group peptidase (beta-lactamase class C family) [Streptomonospora nanhaiensis]|uniref:CubicO group peptidase (Beta-lactamase class C family) n=1 Tax=Streptomonospora nanhaiensis TaxID=1323731 RepID=A0A853BJD3_9ACTN|nr:serine hydrolase domain-containing protein [Streptomonospora nanhaiensis]NYI94626.1 CubicO group peptidase (beta-lactamase class C family) [Streptomonospora nanhaiensis]
MRVLASVLSLALAVSAAAGPTAPAAAAAAPPGRVDPAEVDAFVTGYLDRHGLPGAAVAVVRDGETVHEAGYGEGLGGAPLTEHSRLRIGSVAKSFTAFAVLRLADEGRVDLDAPVTRYLPDFRPDRGITLRQLLSHTSGLPSPVVVAPATTLEEGVARIAEWELSAEPGTSYAYSNANYWVAARVVEAVAGRPFGDHLAERVFAPLGMDDTVGTTTPSEPVEGLVPGHVTAYGGALPAPEPEAMNGGAGGVVSTAHDMAAWLAMQQRGGIGPDGRRLLSEALVEESRNRQPHAGRAGLGWRHSGEGVTPARVSHSGVTAGFNAQQDLVTGSGYGVAVLVNAFSPAREHAYEISSGIIDLTEGRTPDPGAPTATAVDLVLGALTAAALALGVLGLRRSGRWAARRAAWPAWRFGLRLLPQLAAPALAVFLFLVAPALEGNSYTTADAFRLFPAFMVLVAALAAAGAALTAARVAARVRTAAPGAGEARR